MYYVIDSIRVVRRGSWVSFRRNEVTKIISIDNVKGWMRSLESVKPIVADDMGSKIHPKRESTRTQRNMLALQGVEYIITAEVRLTELGWKAGQNIKKYRDEIERRAKSGKCFHRPCLGVREFAADFEWEDDAQTALQRRERELADNWRTWPEDDLGLMLYDLFETSERAKGFRWLSTVESEALLNNLRPAAQKKLLKQSLWNVDGQHIEPAAAFFNARVRNSVLDCHPERVDLKCRNGGTS